MDRDFYDYTLEYYNNNALKYVELTQGAALDSIYNKFLSKVPSEASILDLGCGSGRDSLFFLEKGYNVTAIDGSKEICAITSKRLGQTVRNLNIMDIDYNNQFDGVWACASLLHIPEGHLKGVLNKIYDALKYDGALYASWKYGEKEEVRGGRFYCDMTEEKLLLVLSSIKNFIVEELWVSEDVFKRTENNKWLNVIIKKTPYVNPLAK